MARRVFYEIDGRCSGSPVGVTVWAHFCEIDGRVLGGMQFWVLQVILRDSRSGALGVLFGALFGGCC